MASNLLIGFLLGVGAAGYIYARTMHSTGNNSKSSLLVACIAGVMIMFLAMTLLALFL